MNLPGEKREKAQKTETKGKIKSRNIPNWKPFAQLRKLSTKWKDHLLNGRKYCKQYMKKDIKIIFITYAIQYQKHKHPKF